MEVVEGGRDGRKVEGRREGVNEGTRTWRERGREK